MFYVPFVISRFVMLFCCFVHMSSSCFKSCYNFQGNFFWWNANGGGLEKCLFGSGVDCLSKLFKFAVCLKVC